MDPFQQLDANPIQRLAKAAAERAALEAALEAAAKDHHNEVAFELTTQSAEASISGEKGRLSGTAYGKAVWGLTKEYVAGVRGAWRLGKP